MELDMPDQVDRISYIPDRTSYYRQREISRENDSTDCLPNGFPTQLSSPMVWDRQSLSLDGQGFVNDERCMLELTTEQLAEVHSALQHFKGLELPLKSLDTKTFPLPSLSSILRGISENIHQGTGFCLVRGIPVDDYSREENVIIYVGLASHIAPLFGRQDHQYQGDPADVMLAHITDFSSTVEPGSATLPAYTDGEVIFHTDTGDIVSLFALEEPVKGGESLLASGWRIYNELARTRPDLIDVLAKDWPIPSSKKPGQVIHRPLMFYQHPSQSTPERLIIHFSRRSFSGFGGWSHSNKLSAKQAEVLDALHFLAEEFHVAMPLRKGDMQFINNMSLLHARNSYTDGPNHRRHLLRLWLRDPENAWKLPTVLHPKWDKLYDEEHRNGEQVFPLEPEMRSAGKPAS